MTVAFCNMPLLMLNNYLGFCWTFYDMSKIIKQWLIFLTRTCYGWMKHIATVYYMFIPGIAQTKCSGFITVHGHYSLVSKFVKLVNFTVLKNVWIHGKLSNLDKYFCRSLCDSVMYIAVEATLIDTNERCTWLSFCVWCILD